MAQQPGIIESNGRTITFRLQDGPNGDIIAGAGPLMLVDVLPMVNKDAPDPVAEWERVWAEVKKVHADNAAIRPDDKVSIERINKLHPKVRAEVLQLLRKANAALTGRAQVRIVQGLRTFPEQTALYAQGRTKPGKIVTNAKAGQSFHNYGLAIDFALLIDGKEISWSTTADFDTDKVPDWMEVVAIFKAAGWSWGGDWKKPDRPHFEKTFGKTWQQLKALHDGMKVNADGYVKI